MADEQPGYIARGMRDVSRVPLAKELVKDNVGSTVTQQSLKFVAVSQAASAEASALYLDPSLQARASPKASGATNNENAMRGTSGTALSAGGGSGVGSTVDGAELEKGEVRPVGRTTEAAKETEKKEFNQGPVVIMSDADNYRPDPKRRKAKKRKKCIIQ